ncbi:MAG: bifunctional diaminohydroxyphosphoribosylaminopyrimidine deaminase/5-amino-6-(5-phosphoribosylamino)uracil reductase RibD [Bdellovibrionaceae bacterium]|nr:bifunctional diaminohydroxyphosphoribosylaminopyrimidine deaminase/5-amino-6-(5-phosphoribosylamino)uracil reductase RibD [Pseudobdellovibrionaceae bacterium]
MDEKVSPGDFLTNAGAMSLAIAEARRGAAHVSPNPPVGCVILDAGGRFLAAGHHEKHGTAHAEVNAVRGLPMEALRGAQVFVTLEPCAHEGKTPSCARMLAKLPVARVVYGLRDPNPLVSGQGAGILREAGIPCDLYSSLEGDHLRNELEDVAEIFLWNFRQGKIFVALKTASSLDGRIALADGRSKWITGPESRRRVHELRADHDAVLVGSGTVIADDPALDVRHPLIRKKNKVVVLDGSGRLASRHEEFQLGRLRAAEEVVWIHEKLPLPELLDHLWSLGLRSVLIEGGGRVGGAFLRESLVNRLHLFQAPVLLGSTGLSWSEGLAVGDMAQRPSLQQVQRRTFGRDSYLTGLLRNPWNGAAFRDM